MKTRIVMWGSNEKDQKVLIAIALRAEDNVVDIFTFPFESTTEEFYNLMLNEWRESHEVPFPEGFAHITRPLTASDHILPPELKVDRVDIIQRAQTEWHFVVLSNKLFQAFQGELQEIRDKIKGSDIYKSQLWESMKETWERIQKNIFDKTLLREHGQQLREMTNDIFTELKNMRKQMDSEFDRTSKDLADKFNARLDEVEEKIKSGLGLQPLFNDLKRMQQEFKEAQLSRGDRARIWKRIDTAFKSVKEKKFGEKSSRDTSALDRLNRRYEGLLSAIDKMEKSIRRDDKDKSFQDDRIANTEGQLEAQIRMAKLKMIDERIASKNEKLAEMQKTKTDLEERINREKKFMEEQKKQQALKEELKEAKENVKQKIAETIHAQTEHLDPDALEKAAEAIAEEKAQKSKPRHKETLLGAIGETLGESLTDLGDSLGAVASVVSDKIEEAYKEFKEDAREKVNDLKEDVRHLKEESKEMGDQFKEGAQILMDKAKVKVEELKADAQHLKEETEESTEQFKEGAKILKEKARGKAEGLKEEVHHLDDSFDKMKGEVKEKLEEIREDAAHLAEDLKDKVEEIGQEIRETFEELKAKVTGEGKGEEGGEEKKEEDAS